MVRWGVFFFSRWTALEIDSDRSTGLRARRDGMARNGMGQDQIVYSWTMPLGRSIDMTPVCCEVKIFSSGL